MSKSASSKSNQKAKSGEVLVGENRKARHEYEILDTFEAGMVLRGTEVKVLRQGQISLSEAYARFKGDQLFLVNANIPEYSHGNLQNHEPKRWRKLLLLGRWRRRADLLLCRRRRSRQGGWRSGRGGR